MFIYFCDCMLFGRERKYEREFIGSIYYVILVIKIMKGNKKLIKMRSKLIFIVIINYRS